MEAHPAARRIGRAWIAAAALAAMISAAAVVAVVMRSDRGAARAVGAAQEQRGAAAAPIASRALDHVPAGCELILHVDLARLLASPAAKSQIAPVLEEIVTGSSAASAPVRDLLRAAAVDPRRDVTDVIVCAGWFSGPVEERRLAIVLGGSFRQEGVVRAVRGPLEELDGHRFARVESSNGAQLLVGQAADGAVVITNHGPWLEDAIGATRPAPAIPAEPEIALLLEPSFLEPWSSNGGPLAEHSGDVLEALVTISLADGGRSELRAAMRDDAAAAALAASLGRMVADARSGARAGGASLLGAAKVRAEGSRVALDAPLGDARVDELARQIATALRRSESRAALAL